LIFDGRVAVSWLPLIGCDLTNNSSSLAPLGERGDRKAEGAPRSAGGGGEGISRGQIDDRSPQTPYVNSAGHLRPLVPLNPSPRMPSRAPETWMQEL
jgi:hypothetical protein